MTETFRTDAILNPEYHRHFRVIPGLRQIFSHFKGPVSRGRYFFKAILISTFCRCSDGFLRSFKSFLLILKMLIETLLRIPFFVTGRCVERLYCKKRGQSYVWRLPMQQCFLNVINIRVLRGHC